MSLTSLYIIVIIIITIIIIFIIRPIIVDTETLRGRVVRTKSAIKNGHIAKLHLRGVDRLDVLNADVAADPRLYTVELDAVGHVRVDSQ